MKRFMTFISAIMTVLLTVPSSIAMMIAVSSMKEKQWQMPFPNQTQEIIKLGENALARAGITVSFSVLLPIAIMALVALGYNVVARQLGMPKNDPSRVNTKTFLILNGAIYLVIMGMLLVAALSPSVPV